ncbi:DciA family protein [Actinotalea sp. M2MS4P-6]|uniref:DUF721 domain-containing protein n=1 Tax=Actinotalea sp. M2MS4P-6 TaxID=2983762 RepID=UPI0021E4728B|nr:DciA family protein [Actinotalea sp. M2MS4P-6]MCV2392837.1 DciA family protein [Actinotalea sp. M2MS4P-6]
MSAEREHDGARPAEERPDDPRVEGGITPPVAEQLGLSASDVGRAALNRAKAAARRRGLHPGSPGVARGSRAEERSGPARDGRDPVPVGESLTRLAAERGWSTDLSVGGVIGRWREVVGDQVADHCEPEAFTDGVLAVRADSTAWATNLGLLVPELMTRLATELGPDVVQEVRVLGPAAPRWTKGRRSVRGQGPRDTYG